MAPPLSGAQHVLDRAIEARVFPGAVVEVGRSAGPVHTLLAGRLTYDANAPEVDASTIYDLASLTKVLATTALTLEHIEAGRLGLGDRVGRCAIQDLLEHCAGLPDHRPYYRTLRGRAAYERAIAAEPLAYEPRAQSIYTDLGFILLGFAVEAAARASLDEQFTRWRDRELTPAAEIRFTPPASWTTRTAPTEVADDATIQGTVHDENAAALGGVAGHAGLFGTASAVGACARWWLTRVSRAQPGSTLARFIQRSAVAGSSRALGWDTMLPTSSCGTRLSPRALGHTGFTGTSLWIDPGLDLYVVFLSNRVHPSRQGDGIQQVRRELHDAIVHRLNP